MRKPLCVQEICYRNVTISTEAEQSNVEAE